MNSIRERGAFVGVCSYAYCYSRNIHLCLFVLTTWNSLMIRFYLTVPWKRRIILFHCSLNYWCPSSLCIINLVMVLGHQRETLLRSREWKTGSVGYCNQVEGQPKCLGKDQMVMKRWPPVERRLHTNSWRGASDHTLGRKLEEEERAANFSF